MEDIIAKAAEKGGIAFIFVVYLYLERLWRAKEQAKRDEALTESLGRGGRINLMVIFVLGQWLSVARRCTAKVAADNPSAELQPILDVMPKARCTNCKETFRLSPDWLERGTQMCPRCNTQVSVPDMLFGNPFNEGA